MLASVVKMVKNQVKHQVSKEVWDIAPRMEQTILSQG